MAVSSHRRDRFRTRRKQHGFGDFRKAAGSFQNAVSCAQCEAQRFVLIHRPTYGRAKAFGCCSGEQDNGGLWWKFSDFFSENGPFGTQDSL
jgi:hypothetical protein